MPIPSPVLERALRTRWVKVALPFTALACSVSASGNLLDGFCLLNRSRNDRFTGASFPFSESEESIIIQILSIDVGWCILTFTFEKVTKVIL